MLSEINQFVNWVRCGRIFPLAIGILHINCSQNISQDVKPEEVRYSPIRSPNLV